MGLFMKLFQKRAKANATKKTNYDLTYDNVAIPEIHTHKVTEHDSNDNVEESPDARYDSVAIPEIHIKKK